MRRKLQKVRGEISVKVSVEKSFSRDEIQVFDLRSKSALNAFLAECENAETTETTETRIAIQNTMEIQPLVGQLSLFEAVSA